MYKVKVKAGMNHGAGGKYPAGSELEVTQEELDAFGDKFVVLEQTEEKKSLRDIKATKAAFKAAEELGFDISKIPGGTGKNGTVTLSDVHEFYNTQILE